MKRSIDWHIVPVQHDFIYPFQSLADLFYSITLPLWTKIKYLYWYLYLQCFSKDWFPYAFCNCEKQIFETVKFAPTIKALLWMHMFLFAPSTPTQVLRQSHHLSISLIEMYLLDLGMAQTNNPCQHICNWSMVLLFCIFCSNLVIQFVFSLYISI